MEKVSVIIPVYNVSSYIQKALSSIIGQNYTDMQIVLIDDGSTDGSERVCDLFAKTDRRVMAIHQENKGVSAARNHGLNFSTGKYIFFMDADDYAEPDMLQNMVQAAELGQYDLVIAGFYYESCFADKINGTRVQSYPVTFPRKSYFSREEFKTDFVELWDRNMLYNIANKLYRADIIQKYGLNFPDIDFGEDFDFNKRYLTLCKRIFVDERCYYHYIRERAGASTAKYKADLFPIRVSEHRKLIRYFEEFGVTGAQPHEFLARRHIERVVGCIENVFSNPENRSLSAAYHEVQRIIHDTYTVDAANNAKPRSRKMELMLLPIKRQNTLVSMLMGFTIHLVRKYRPDLFTRLKQKR